MKNGTKKQRSISPRPAFRSRNEMKTYRVIASNIPLRCSTSYGDRANQTGPGRGAVVAASMVLGDKRKGWLRLSNGLFLPMETEHGIPLVEVASEPKPGDKIWSASRGPPSQPHLMADGSKPIPNSAAASVPRLKKPAVPVPTIQKMPPPRPRVVSRPTSVVTPRQHRDDPVEKPRLVMTPRLRRSSNQLVTDPVAKVLPKRDVARGKPPVSVPTFSGGDKMSDMLQKREKAFAIPTPETTSNVFKRTLSAVASHYCESNALLQAAGNKATYDKDEGSTEPSLFSNSSDCLSSGTLDVTLSAAKDQLKKAHRALETLEQEVDSHEQAPVNDIRDAILKASQQLDVLRLRSRSPTNTSASSDSFGCTVSNSTTPSNIGQVGTVKEARDVIIGQLSELLDAVIKIDTTPENTHQRKQDQEQEEEEEEEEEQHQQEQQQDDDIEEVQVTSQPETGREPSRSVDSAGSGRLRHHDKFSDSLEREKASVSPPTTPPAMIFPESPATACLSPPQACTEVPSPYKGGPAARCLARHVWDESCFSIGKQVQTATTIRLRGGITLLKGEVGVVSMPAKWTSPPEVRIRGITFIPEAGQVRSYRSPSPSNSGDAVEALFEEEVDTGAPPPSAPIASVSSPEARQSTGASAAGTTTVCVPAVAVRSVTPPSGGLLPSQNSVSPVKHVANGNNFRSFSSSSSPPPDSVEHLRRLLQNQDRLLERANGVMSEPLFNPPTYNANYDDDDDDDEFADEEDNYLYTPQGTQIML
eukprot:TRINITY_DN17509_c0_g2_i1.p1 TRINITY_DN17509_c0_g2~~TRINITY_DN17509_c0_g2_i1.p1  ORF type:complete len:758 (+),score=156.30 TRINITY_DN17509_c0_g2_i1:63-2336(+)